MVDAETVPTYSVDQEQNLVKRISLAVESVNKEYKVSSDQSNQIVSALAITLLEHPTQFAAEDFSSILKTYDALVRAIFGGTVHLFLERFTATECDLVMLTAKKLRQAQSIWQETTPGGTSSMIGRETWTGKLDIFIKENQSQIAMAKLDRRLN